MAASLIGQQLGKYKIVSMIGHGGMASVYKAYQQDLGRHVAVKVLPPHPGRDQQFTERFQLEARTVARLQHPHILPLHDYGAQDDILYLVMALVETGSLSDRLRRGAMPARDVERLLVQLASALDYAHRQGVIHRDIKPDNILIDGEGFPLLADFGIAKMVQEEGGLTVSGSLLGTPAYMSPEQGQGLAAGPRSDIYSLGVVVYEMLTGKHPYTAETPMQIVMKHLTEMPPLVQEYISGLPLTVDEVMRCVLAKQPENRYPTATAFAEDFSRALRGSQPLLGQASEGSTTLQFLETPTVDSPAPAPTAPPTQSAPPTTGQVTVVTAPGNQLMLLGAAVLIVLLVAAVLILALREDNRQSTTPIATQAQVAQEPTMVALVAPPATSAPTFGRVRFATSGSLGDTVNLQVENLAQPGNERSYAAWLVNPAGETLLLGALRVDSLGNGILTYTDTEARALPTLYNGVIVTRETSIGDAPEGETVYSGSLPAEVPLALREILIESEAGIDGGSLYDGLIAEARIARQHTGYAAGANNLGGMRTHAEHTINILLGTTDDLNGDGSPQNPGRGVGVQPLLDEIEARLETVASMPSASATLQSQIELIRTCTLNTRLRLERILEIERSLLSASTMEEVANILEESTEVASQMIDGFDLNNNGQVEPFEGECGIEQIPVFGIPVGNLDLVAGGLPEGA